MKGLLEAALGYAQRGWRVFPLHGIVNGACTCGRAECSSHPLVRRGLYEATTDVTRIEGWWRRWRRANIGVATGAESGIAGIDIDLGHRPNTSFGSPGEEGQGQRPDVWSSLDVVLDKLPRTLTGVTGGGGLHLLYRARSGQRLRNHTSSLPGMRDLPAIDLRAEGGYIVGPPSAHLSGNRYEWLDASVAIADAPDWLREPPRRALVMPSASLSFAGDGTPVGLKVLRKQLAILQRAREGERNHTLNRCAFVVARYVAAGHLLEPAARSELFRVALTIGLSSWETVRTLDSAFGAVSRHSGSTP